MLKKILSISGKPGLHKFVSQSKNMIIVESLMDGKRFPAYSHERVISLGDISIYTQTEEVPLAEVFEKIKLKTNAEKAICEKSSEADLRAYFEEILPDYDKSRVYKSDVKKVIQWYNILIEKGFTDFLAEEEA